MLIQSRDVVGVPELLQMSLPDLRRLRAENLAMALGPEAFDHIFKECDALWQHSGDPKDPHAELTSGMCSDGFVDVLRVLRYTTLCEIMAAQIADKVIDLSYLGFPMPDWVIGSDHAGAVLAFEVARQLGVMSDFTEKGEGKSQVWKRFQIEKGAKVLQVEELMTTSLTASEVRKGLVRGNLTPIEFVPYMFTLVNRSTQTTFENAPLHSVRQLTINTWDPSECPLCAAGSERVKPKANWAKLTGKTK